MGEKGIGGEVAAVVPAGSSLIEKTTTSVVTSVTGVGSDVLTTVQEKAVGAFADEAIEAARQKLSPDPTTPEATKESTEPDQPDH
ncbi:MAG TPA: hypothetical protein VHQ23_07940 [Ilumatobacteraceae bacterium]|jgi:hypothetical protein|nr:hypothetical protein [Ilumatobacteraceae bacterium]